MPAVASGSSTRRATCLIRWAAPLCAGCDNEDMKLLIALALLGIIAALASAGVFMLKKSRDGDGRNNKMARALALRVGLSIALFLLVLFSYWMGWVQPSGLPANH